MPDWAPQTSQLKQQLCSLCTMQRKEQLCYLTLCLCGPGTSTCRGRWKEAREKYMVSTRDQLGQKLKSLSFKVLQPIRWEKAILTCASASSYGSTKTVVAWIRISSCEQKRRTLTLWLNCNVCPRFCFGEAAAGWPCCAGPEMLAIPTQLPSLPTYLGTVCLRVTFHVLHSSQSLKATNHSKRERQLPAVTASLEYSHTLTSNIITAHPLYQIFIPTVFSGSNQQLYLEDLR